MIDPCVRKAFYYVAQNLTCRDGFQVDSMTPYESDQEYWGITQLLFSLLCVKAVCYESLLSIYTKMPTSGKVIAVASGES